MSLTSEEPGGSATQDDANKLKDATSPTKQSECFGQSKRKRSDTEKGDATDPNDICYFRAYTDIQIHQTMIKDEVRTQAFRLAIFRNYKHFYGKVVADVGAGTGILSVFCVQAGAKKVYAIEACDIAEQTQLVVNSNHMQDRITVIRGKVEDVTLPEKVDVIVSEWMGYMLFYECVLPSVIFARDNWLKPNGLIFPKSASLYLAPFTDYEYYNNYVSFWDQPIKLYKVDMSALKPYSQQCLSRLMHIDTFSGENIMARENEICHIDLRKIPASHLEKFKSEFRFDCYGDEYIHGFVGWFKVFFPAGVFLSTSPCDRETHWHQTAIYLREPLRVKQGDIIKGSITLSQNSIYKRFLDAEIIFTHNHHSPVTVYSQLIIE